MWGSKLLLVLSSVGLASLQRGYVRSPLVRAALVSQKTLSTIPALLGDLPSVVCPRILESFGLGGSFKGHLVQLPSPTPLLCSQVVLKVRCREVGAGLGCLRVADGGCAVGSALADGRWVQQPW